jgi:hypothetical protein
MYAKNNGRYEVLTPSGWQDFNGVRLTGPKPLYKMTLSTGAYVTATAQHKFLINGQEVKLSDITVNDSIDIADGVASVLSIDAIDTRDAYDLVEVKDTEHRFFVNGSVVTKNCDEFAFLQPSLARGFWTSLSPTLSTGGKILVTSTPSSDEDQFAEIWFGANRTIDANGNETDVGENGFKAYMATWSRHPDRDEAWAAAERASIGEDRFLREHECVAKDTEISLCDESGREFSMTVQHLFDRLKCQSQTQQHMGNSHNDDNLHSEVKTTSISP